MGQLQTKKIYVHQLETGMYVSGLDRPWLETPFYLQGFMIRNAGDVQKLSLYCDYVYVDYERSVANLDIEVSHKLSHSRKLGVAATPFNKELSARRIVKYEDKIAVTSKIRDANNAYQQIKDEFDSMANRIGSGKALNISNLSEVVNPLVDSVVRNPGASIWLARLKSQDSYTYRHCIAVAIWCSVIGRQIGLPKKELALLSMGGMLLDIGKLKIPGAVLNKKQQLSEREFSLVKKHVDLSLKMAADSSRRIPQAVMDMIASHHERFNGCGYPQQLAGTDIPLYARIAGIVDCYDAMTSPRYYATPIPHSEAILKLAGWRSRLFQKELVDTFIQAIGLYPPGSLVELTNGEVAVVSDYKAGMGRKPKLTIILDINKRRLSKKKVLSLSGKEGTIDIARNLPPDAYNLDPEALF